MGIGKLSWKKIVSIVASSIVFLITVIMGWHIVLDILIFVKNIFLEISKFSISPIGRDVLLFVLISILFWLYLNDKKKKKVIPAQPEKFYGGQEKKEEKGDWQFDWDSKHDFILEKFIEKDAELNTGYLFEAYKEGFPEDSEKKFNIRVFDLEEAGLIKHRGSLGNKKLYSLTKEGRRHYMKRLREKRPETEEREPELAENQLFILALLAGCGEDSINSLFMSYKETFPEASLIEVKNIAIVLERNGLIRHSGNFGGGRLYTVTDKGIERISKEPEIMKKYEKAIEKHIELSKKASQY